MNKYTVEFFSNCPINGIRVKYILVISTSKVIFVESILKTVSKCKGTHENIADYLKNIFGGNQKLKAFHHGVLIETIR